MAYATFDKYRWFNNKLTCLLFKIETKAVHTSKTIKNVVDFIQ